MTREKKSPPKRALVLVLPKPVKCWPRQRIGLKCFVDEKADTSTDKPEPIHAQPLAVRMAARALYRARMDRKAAKAKQQQPAPKT